jgi:hypothetical protein
MPGASARTGGHNAQFGYNGQTFEMPGYGSSTTNRYRFQGTEYPSLAAVRAAIDRYNQDMSYREAQRAQASGMGFTTDAYGRTIYRNGPGSGGGGGGGGTGSSAGGGTGTVDFSAALNQVPAGDEPWINPPGADEDQAAIAASYGRAKERAGGEALGASRSIRALMARRGLGGSRFALGQEARAITGGQQNLAEFNRDEAIGLAKRRQNVSDMGYQGGIAQRGQNIGSRQQRTSHALSLAALQARG